METFLKILPYIITVISSIITGFATYFCAAKNGKNEINKLKEQQKLEMELQKQAFDSEIEKMALQHKFEIEKMNMQKSNTLEDTLTKTILSNPEAITGLVGLLPIVEKIKKQTEQFSKDKK